MSTKGHQNEEGDKMEFTDLYIGLAKAMVYHIARAGFIIFRTLIWIANGTMIDYWSSSKPENYDHSAQVYDVKYRYKLDVILGQSSFTDFVLTHDKFVHPMYLLRDECVLYQVTGSHAIFVEVDQGVDIWRGKHGSFLRQAQFQQAKKVITLPLPALERLAESLGPNEAKVIFVQNTARCGSTLLVRMFESTGQCVSFCEPDAVNGICKMAISDKKWDEETGIRIVRNLVRVLCKPVKSLKQSPMAYIIKMTAPSMGGAPFVASAFPEAHHMFMYRDVTKMCQSLATSAEVMPTVKLVLLLGTISGTGFKFAVAQMGVTNADFNMKLSDHPYGVGIILYGVTCSRYLEMRKDGTNIAGIRYEDLAEDPEYFMTQVLKFCNMPTSLTEEALKATAKDAQENSQLSMSNLKTLKKNYKVTPEIAAFRKEYLEAKGLPTEPAPVLSGTITHKSAMDKPECVIENQKPAIRETVEKLIAEALAEVSTMSAANQHQQPAEQENSPENKLEENSKIESEFEQGTATATSDLDNNIETNEEIPSMKCSG